MPGFERFFNGSNPSATTAFVSQMHGNSHEETKTTNSALHSKKHPASQSVRGDDEVVDMAALQAQNRVDAGYYHHATSMGKPYTRQAFGEQHPSDPRYAGYEQYVQEGPPNKKRKRQEVFGNARDAPALRDQALEDEDMHEAPSRQRRQGLNHEVPIGATYATNTVSVSRSQLNSAMKSKLDMYNILAIEGQLYLPPFQDCTMDFIKQLVTGQKKVSLPLITM